MTASTGRRRAKGDGSLAERSPGVWRLRVFTGTDPLTKRPRQAERTFRGSKTGALKALRELVAEVEAGMHKSSSGTVGHLLRIWPEHLERTGAQPATIESYRTIITKHLVPALGPLELRKLTALEIDSYYAAKSKAGLADGTIRMHGAILSSALTQAVKWGWIGANPCSGATLPKKVKSTRSSPGVDGVRKLIEAAGDDIDLATAVVVGALTGARRGELCGLQWPDVDRVTGTIAIERARVALTGGDVTGPPKGGKPRRVAIGALGLAVLDRYAEALDIRAGQLGIERDPNGWLLSHDCGHTPFTAKWLSRTITALGKKAGVPIVTHELRHYAATEMVSAGVDVVTAAARLGHSPEMLLRVYAHAMPSRDVAAAAMLERGVLATAEIPIGEEPGSFT